MDERADRARTTAMLGLYINSLSHFTRMEGLGGPNEDINYHKIKVGTAMLSLLPPTVTTLSLEEGIVAERDSAYMERIPLEERVEWSLSDAINHHAQLQQQVDQDRSSRFSSPRFRPRRLY